MANSFRSMVRREINNFLDISIKVLISFLFRVSGLGLHGVQRLKRLCLEAVISLSMSPEHLFALGEDSSQKHLCVGRFSVLDVQR